MILSSGFLALVQSATGSASAAVAPSATATATQAAPNLGSISNSQHLIFVTGNTITIRHTLQRYVAAAPRDISFTRESGHQGIPRQVPQGRASNLNNHCAGSSFCR
jgi:hypothetical protein